MADIRKWREDAKQYVKAGKKCVLWGRSVRTMNRNDLLAFIGFLDILATQRYRDAHKPNR